MTFTPSEFRPRFTGGHVQTLYAWVRTRTFPRLPVPVARYFGRPRPECSPTATGTSDRPITLLLLLAPRFQPGPLHGRDGRQAWACGWVVRLNQQLQGPEHLSRGLPFRSHERPLVVVRELMRATASAPSPWPATRWAAI